MSSTNYASKDDSNIHKSFYFDGDSFADSDTDFETKFQSTMLPSTSPFNGITYSPQSLPQWTITYIWVLSGVLAISIIICMVRIHFSIQNCANDQGRRDSKSTPSFSFNANIDQILQQQSKANIPPSSIISSRVTSKIEGELYYEPQPSQKYTSHREIALRLCLQSWIHCISQNEDDKICDDMSLPDPLKSPIDTIIDSEPPSIFEYLELNGRRIEEIKTKTKTEADLNTETKSMSNSNDLNMTPTTITSTTTNQQSENQDRITLSNFKLPSDQSSIFVPRSYDYEQVKKKLSPAGYRKESNSEHKMTQIIIPPSGLPKPPPRYNRVHPSHRQSRSRAQPTYHDTSNIPPFMFDEAPHSLDESIIKRGSTQTMTVTKVPTEEETKRDGGAEYTDILTTNCGRLMHDNEIIDYYKNHMMNLERRLSTITDSSNLDTTRRVSEQSVTRTFTNPKRLHLKVIRN